MSINDNELDFLNNEDVAIQHLQDKKQAYIQLYKKIEFYYTSFGSNAYDILNDINTKNDIIVEILNCNDDEIEIYLKAQYPKINKQLFNEYKNYDNNIEDENSEVEASGIHINWSYLFHVILNILLFPVLLICSVSLTYDHKKRRRR